MYIKIQGTAKDSISSIEGNIYNIISGTRSIFKTEKKDSVYSSDIEIYESIYQSELELNVYLKEDTKQVTIDLTGKLDFSESRIQVISVDVTFGLLGLEVYLNDYQSNKEVNDDLEPR